MTIPTLPPGPWRRLLGRSRIWSNFPLLADPGECAERVSWSCLALPTSLLTADAATLWRCCVFHASRKWPSHFRARRRVDGCDRLNRGSRSFERQQKPWFPIDNIGCILLFKLHTRCLFFQSLPQLFHI